MSYYVDTSGERDYIFGQGGARKLAEKLQLPFLGEIPLVRAIREASDAGRPIVLTDPESPSGRAFIHVTEAMAAQVSIRGMQGELGGKTKVTF